MTESVMRAARKTGPRGARVALIALPLCALACGGAPPPPEDELVVRVRVRDDLCPVGGCPGAEAEALAEPPMCDVGGPDGLAVLDLAAGMTHMCATLSDGHVRCWGPNHNSTLGNGEHGRTATPVSTRNVERAANVEAGRMHSCALVEGGRVWCWGSNDWGALGTGDRRVPSPNLPGEVPRLRGVEQVAVGRDHSCARTGRGQVQCWGKNHVGQLGDGSDDIRLRPTPVGRLSAIDLAAGGDSTCAVKQDGTVACWGAITGTQRPTAIDGLPGPAANVAVGDSAACARLLDGAVACWGDGSHGTLGPAGGAASDAAVRVEGLPPAQTLSMGATYGCIVDVQGAVWCWGSTEAFDQELSNPRQRAGMGPARAVAVNGRAACAALAQGGVCCWGSNVDGLLGTQWRPFANPGPPAEWPVPLEW